MANISLKNVVKHYDNNPVINDVSLEIDDGDFVVFVGPSGCGKSTLLRMIAGLESISGGEIFINDQCVNDIAARDRGVAMVFQSYALYPHMTVAENMSFALKNLGIPKDEINQKVANAATVLQIEPLLHRKPKDMSGGQRQRVAIGRAIVREPKVFLFDEPLSNLDAALRVQMRTELARLHHHLNTTMIYVTHDQIEAMTMASKIVVLRAGIIEQVGSPLDLYHFPKNKFVAGFLGSPKMNFIDGVITHIEQVALSAHADHLFINKLTIKTNAGFIIESYSDNHDLIIEQHITVGIRPEHFHCLDEQANIDLNRTQDKLAANNLPHSISNSLICSVDVIEQLGNTSYIYLKLPSGESCTIENKRTKHYKFGEKISITVDFEKIHLFNQYDKSIKYYGAIEKI